MKNSIALLSIALLAASGIASAQNPASAKPATSAAAPAKAGTKHHLWQHSAKAKPAESGKTTPAAKTN